MPRYNIEQTVEYQADAIEADSPEEALSIYLKEQDSYYVQVVEENIEEIVWCEECDNEEGWCECDE